jgi:tetratricopeptide (TPR) repeat protein
MIRLVLTYGLILTATLGWCDFNDGNELFEKGDYKAAIEQYSLKIADGNYSSELYYNLGNAYYRNQEIGKAIWAYESALKIDPGHDDAIFNLEFANAQTVDKIDTARHGFGHWLKASLFSFCINIWAYISVGCSFLLSLFAIYFLRSRTKRNKNLSLLGSTVFGFLLIVSTALAYLNQSMITDQSEAVVIVEQVDIRISPMEDAKTSFVLSEGVKLNVIGKEKDWVQIDLNGNQGWVPNESIWKI